MSTTAKAVAILAGGGILLAGAFAQTTKFEVEGDGIPKSLTGKPGDPARGRALIAERGAANCLTCHSIKDKQMQPGGTSAPALDGVGAALTPAQLRLSVVDYARVSRGTAMPSFHKTNVIGSDKPALTAAEIEDIVAYLSTLRK